MDCNQHCFKQNQRLVIVLTISHSCRDHWIVASTVNCKELDTVVVVYDFLYRAPDKATTDIIGNLLHSTIVKLVKCQKQRGITNCGVFTTAIAHIVYTTDLKLNQAAMQSHLIKCFEEGTLFSLVPSLGKNNLSTT